jgi:DNA-binding IclR family transcriptional regulator
MQITEIRDMRVRRRLWLLGYLPTEEPGKTVADLVREAGVGANYVYYSLRILRKAGLVRTHGWGRWMRYLAAYQIILKQTEGGTDGHRS